MGQREKAETFKALHEGSELFVIPNPWDAGTAKLLTTMGFQALTTTSAGLAFALGRPDGGRVTRGEALENARQIVAATELPVAADLENGYGHRPEDVIETIERAAEIGLVGASIEDASNDPDKPIYDFGLAVERIAAAVQAVEKLGFPFMLVGRAENFLHGREDFDDTLKRLQAFERAGADVLFAPGLKTIEQIRLVCQSVTKPVNAIASPAFTVDELRAAGVRRVSTGSSFYRAALSGLQDAARQVLDSGTFGYAARGMSYADIQKLMD